MNGSPEAPRVLIATTSVRGNSGTDLYTRDLALALLRRGWLPIVYATHTGPVAEELRAKMVPVVDDLTRVGARPDVIHGHHHLETLAAIARFPTVPALFVCHDAFNWHSLPPAPPLVSEYVAVDRNTRDRMMLEYGIPADRIQVLSNPVDLERFVPRGPLPPQPRRALVFSNRAPLNTWVVPIRAACEQRGLALDVIGTMAGRQVDQPETLLGKYDLVFARGRCALEAAATGCAVIVCDAPGLAGMLTGENVERLRQLNLGVRALQRDITQESILGEIARYDAADAARVSSWLRTAADSNLLADAFIGIYDELRETHDVASPETLLEGLSLSIERINARLHAPAPRSLRERIATKLQSSSLLAAPARVLYRLKKRLEE